MYHWTITLFNYDKATANWNTTVFTGVQLIENRAKSYSTKGLSNTEGTTAVIHVSRNRQYGGKQYVSPKEYAKQADHTGYFTFTPERDFFAIGDYSSDTPMSDDDYEEGGLYQEMNAEYDGVYMISAATYYSLLPHFEVEGK